jgi:N-acetylglucosaminyl-diphospho-decaprenol L-rhamnosyltransferase
VSVPTREPAASIKDSDRTDRARPPAAAARVLVVIVNYRSASLAIDCLASIEPEMVAHPNASVVVTDNESGDDSIPVLEAAVRDRGWAGWAEIRALGHNGGFAFGNNGAIAPALASPEPPDYVWLLNPDTVARPGAMAELIAFLHARPDVGMAGSRLEDPDGTPQMSAFRFPSILGELDQGARLGPLHRLLSRWTAHPTVGAEPRAVDWVAGASLMVRREVFDSVGLLDDGFFMYYEEVDFCLRAARAGWPCWYVPSSRVVHLVGQSSGVTDPSKRRNRVPGYWFEARKRYFLKNHGKTGTTLANLAWTAGAISFKARNTIQRKPDDSPQGYFRDFVRHNFSPMRPR